MRERLRAYKTQLSVTLASFLALVWIPFVNRSRHGDLSDWYSDHLHHPFATFVAFTKGLVIYTRTFQEIWDNTGYPLEMKSWGQMPGMAYPPGVFVVFTPMMLIGKLIPMSLHTFGVINIVYMLILAHLAFFAVLISLKHTQQGSRAVTAVIIWMFLASLASEGFYDTVFVGAGAMVVFELAGKRPERALVWLCIGALLHFRMAAFAPLGLYAIYVIIRERRKRPPTEAAEPAKPLPWKTFAFVAVTAVLVVGSFWLMLPTTGGFQAANPPVLEGDVTGKAKWVVIILSVGVAAAAFYFSDVIVALIVLTCLLLVLVERQPYWWHGAILLAPLLAVGVTGKARNASVARAALVIWAVSISPIVWRDPAFQLFRTFIIAFKR